MITFLTGDLFTVPDLDALAQGVNCVGVMGAGIAREFRRRWPAMYEEYRKICQRGELKPGNVHTWTKDGTTIFNLATQRNTGPGAQIDFLSISVRDMLVIASISGLRRVGIPRIGCGIGGLSWEQVGSVLTELGSRSPVELVVVSQVGSA